MQTQEGTESMLTLEYKLDGTPAQYGAMDEGIRTVQFLRNKCLRAWMDHLPEGKSFEAMSLYTAVLAKEFAFAGRLGSQARQASAGRAWAAVSRFYDKCKKHVPGKKGYPKFRHDCRSLEYKETAGWRLAPDGKHITFEFRSRHRNATPHRHPRQAWGAAAKPATPLSCRLCLA